MAGDGPAHAQATLPPPHRRYRHEWQCDRDRSTWWQGWNGRAGVAPAAADSTAQLHVDLAAHLFQDAANGELVIGMAGKRAIEIDKVQAPRALGDPTAAHDRWVLAKGGGLVHVALFEANTMTIFQINRRNKQHGAQAAEGCQGFQRRKFRYSARPWSALFSG